MSNLVGTINEIPEPHIAAPVAKLEVPPSSSHHHANNQTAANLVLSISELLEQIFLYTDHRMLLTSCTRVNQQWHSVIIETRSLQRRLFFLPETVTDDGWRLDGESHDPEPLINPLLRYSFPTWFLDNGEATSDEDNRREQIIEEAFSGLPWYDCPEIFMRKEASWRRMQLSQPPTRVVDFLTDYLNVKNETCQLEARINLPANLDHGKGATMGDVYDYVTRMALKQNISASPEVTYECQSRKSHMHWWISEFLFSMGKRQVGYRCRPGKRHYNPWRALIYFKASHELVAEVDGLWPRFESEGYEGNLKPRWKWLSRLWPHPSRTVISRINR